MCNSKMKPGLDNDDVAGARINGRPVLQPACNRVAALEAAARPLKKSLQSPTKPSPPASPKPKPVKRHSNPNSLSSSTEKPVRPRKSAPQKSKKSLDKLSTKIVHCGYELLSAEQAAPGSIAAAHREQASLAQAQRRSRIAHYGRTPGKLEKTTVAAAPVADNQEEKRCSFITPNSDPLYVAYHDEEWGVPVHDDNMLFELLVLSGLQVGLDWTTILKRRDEFRSVFAGFDAELVARFTERQIVSISIDYDVDIVKVRGVVDNSNTILELRKEFGSFDEYLWGFVNHKPISTNYKSSRKIPVKTSKSESVSKDMVRRGFRLVGPTIVHSFMQAAGLTNDHLVSCPCHLHCSH